MYIFMVEISCDKCGKKFKQKGHLKKHMEKKNPCIKDEKLEELVNKKSEKP